MCSPYGASLTTFVGRFRAPYMTDLFVSPQILRD